jgi:predicted TIM-barrel fold metal-dependent hydrolase
VLLSTAYLHAGASRNLPDEAQRVRADNDWTAGQAARFPDRLVAFCGVNPLKEGALAEIERCASRPATRRGLKLHLGNSDVRLEDAGHVAQLRRVFAAANRHRMALVVHLRASISRQRPYGEAQARAFIEQVLPAAPDVPVQVAHFAGSGPGYEDPAAQEVMAVLADAVERADPRTRLLWFDVASIVTRDITPERAAMLARLIRQVGPDRVLYGSDAATGANLRPREAWEAFRSLPLSDKEFDTIARNMAPYLRP